MSQPTPLRCDECGTIVAEIEGEYLVIRSRHHGERHVTKIALKDIERQPSAPHTAEVTDGRKGSVAGAIS